MASDRLENRNFLRELPYYGVNIADVHGLFNNSASISRTPNVYLAKCFQTHLLGELDFRFSLVALTETRITDAKEIDFNPNICGYVF